MKKEFVPYYLAVQLRDLGFNEECLGSFTIEDNSLQIVDMYNLPSVVKAPLWQQAFEFFRKKHNIYFTVDYGIDFIANSKYWKFDKGYPNNTKYKTYEEARLKCLEKLIELCAKK